MLICICKCMSVCMYVFMCVYEYMGFPLFPGTASLLLEVVQPWATGAFRKVLGKSRDLS